jgi:hypothetical protein
VHDHVLKATAIPVELSVIDADLLRTLSTGLFALLGAGVGVAATFAVQHKTARLEREKLRHAARGRVNALSVAVFRDFLAACKEVERIGERREAGDTPDDEYISTTTSAMWLRWEEVAVFCAPDVQPPSLELVGALQIDAWHSPDGENVTTYVNKRRKELFHVSGPIFREMTPLEDQ